MTTVSFKSDIFKYILALNEVRTSTINKEDTAPVFYYTSLFQMNEVHETRPLQRFADCLRYEYKFRTFNQKQFGLYVYLSHNEFELEAIKQLTEEIDVLRGYKLIHSGQHSYHVSDLITERPFADFILPFQYEVLSS